MALNIKNMGGAGKKFTPQANIEAGVYPARLVQIIDLGLQPQKAYQGKEKAPAIEIMLTYELVDEFMKDEAGENILEKPRWISETLPFYGLFADKAKSTHRYNAFDPKGEYEGDFIKALGSAINIAVVHNSVGDKIYDNIGNASTMRPRDAQQCPDLVNPAKAFDLDAPDLAIFNSLPEWIQKKIQGNLNYAGSALEKALGGKPQEKSRLKAVAQGVLKAVKEEEKNLDFDADEPQDNPY